MKTKHQKLSIKNKIVLILMPITILIFLSVCFVTIFQTNKELKENLNKEITLTGSLVSKEMMAKVSKTIGIMDNVKKSIENGNTDTGSVKEYLYSVADAYPEEIPTGIYCGMEDNTYIDKMWTPDDPSWVMKERPWYIEGKEADNVTFGETYMDDMTGSYIVSIYANLKTNGKLLGVISADIPIDDLADILTGQTILNNGYIFAVDGYSKMIFGNKHDESLNGAFISNSEDAFLRKLNEDIDSGILGSIASFENNYYSLSKVEGTNFYTVSVVPKSDLTNILGALATKSILASLIGLLLLASAIYALLTMLFKPFTKIRNQIEHMHALDFTYKEYRKQNDEFGMVIRNLNDLSEKLKETIGLFKNISADLQDSSDKNSDCSKNIDNLTSKQSEAINGLNESVNELSLAIETIADGATKLAGEVNTLAKNTEATKNKTKEAKESVNEGNRHLNDMTDSITAVYKTSDMLKASVDDLHEGLNGIIEMVSMIKEVADQTNLLSLNASIEAARAGETGKGFAVVANEIRTLSDSCQESVVKIEDTTAHLANLVNNVMEKSNNNMTLIKQSEESTKNITSSFAKITDTINEIVSSTEEINNSVKIVDNVASDMAATTEEQNASTEMVLNVVNEINEDSNTIKDKGNEIAKVSNNLNGFVIDLRENVDKFTI